MLIFKNRGILLASDPVARCGKLLRHLGISKLGANYRVYGTQNFREVSIPITAAASEYDRSIYHCNGFSKPRRDLFQAHELYPENPEHRRWVRLKRFR